jgi:lipoyl(octanoyl) transferase
VISVVQLGVLDYSTGLRIQQQLVNLRKEGKIGDVLLLLEHTPVITLGRNAKQKNVLFSQEELAGRGVELFETDRGGDVTFHGPGQLVGYPIFDLRGFTPRLGAVAFVRKVEEALIRVCGDLGVVTGRIPGLTGVWTENQLPAKIAAIGVHISRGVTSHGFALNVTTNLDYFKLIVPCGIADKPVTSLANEIVHAPHGPAQALPDLEQVAELAACNFGRVFEAQTLWLGSLDALLESAPPGPMNQDTPAHAPDPIRRLAREDDIYLA